MFLPLAVAPFVTKRGVITVNMNMGGINIFEDERNNLN
jgi:hypothetical protein